MAFEFWLFVRQALEKSKYEQSLETVRRFIAIAEKELELYYRHIALYGGPSDRNPASIFDNGPRKYTHESGKEMPRRENLDRPTSSFSFSSGLPSDTAESDSDDEELGSSSLSSSEGCLEDDNSSGIESNLDDGEFDSDGELSAERFSVVQGSSGTILG